ncbi:hypothetical protein [Massilia sp.]|uniref:hypothetical protein n=1 Tax=Massilia sp. TaxID=1882437 RepID=UPI00352F70FB
MAALLGKRVRTTQPLPGEALNIDWNNPITKDMTVCLTHADQAYGFAISQDANGFPTVLGNVPYVAGAQANTPQGTGGRPTGSARMYWLPSRGAVNSPNYSLFAFGTCTSLATTQSAIDMDNSSPRYFQFRVDAGKVDFIPFNTSAGDTGRATSPVAMTIAEMSRGFTIGATASPTRTAAFQNGVLTVGGAVSNLITPGVDMPIGIGARTTGTQTWSTGALMLIVIWMRTLTDAEMQSLADNPWQLFAARRRRMWMSPAAFAAYVLRAATASFVASASEAVLSASRRLVAAAGALTSAWMPAGLIASRRLPTDTASFAMTGSPASIIAARKLAANAGTFGWTVTAAPMTASRRLATQSGAFVLSPSTVQMVYTPAQGPSGPTYVLGAVAGSFGLSGSVARLLFNRRLQATTGTLVLTGVAAKLQAARRLQGDSAAFMVAGSAVALRYSGSTGPIDISKIPLARIVVFEGSGSRVVHFEGSGSLIVPFDGSGSRVVVFEGSGSKTVRFE